MLAKNEQDDLAFCSPSGHPSVHVGKSLSQGNGIIERKTILTNKSLCGSEVLD